VFGCLFSPGADKNFVFFLFCGPFSFSFFFVRSIWKMDLFLSLHTLKKNLAPPHYVCLLALPFFSNLGDGSSSSVQGTHAEFPPGSNGAKLYWSSLSFSRMFGTPDTYPPPPFPPLPIPFSFKQLRSPKRAFFFFYGCIAFSLVLKAQIPPLLEPEQYSSMNALSLSMDMLRCFFFSFSKYPRSFFLPRQGGSVFE